MDVIASRSIAFIHSPLILGIVIPLYVLCCMALQVKDCIPEWLWLCPRATMILLSLCPRVGQQFLAIILALIISACSSLHCIVINSFEVLCHQLFTPI